jgi:hypothetical protein
MKRITSDFDRHRPGRSAGMTYIDWASIGVVEAKRSLWRRIHWERLAMLMINAGLWALIAGVFS